MLSVSVICQLLSVSSLCRFTVNRGSRKPFPVIPTWESLDHPVPGPSARGGRAHAPHPREISESLVGPLRTCAACGTKPGTAPASPRESRIPRAVTNFEISFPLHFQSFSSPGNRSPSRPNATLESAICMHHQNPAAPPAPCLPAHRPNPASPSSLWAPKPSATTPPEACG